MSNKIKIFLSGAMQAYEGTNKAKEWRETAKNIFSYSDNVECISPPDYYDYGKNYHKRESEVMRFDLRKIKECDVVLVNLDNIRNSLGTSDEILYAYLNGKPIIGFLETEEKLSEQEIAEKIHTWKYEQIDRIETGKHALFTACSYIRNYYT